MNVAKNSKKGKQLNQKTHFASLIYLTLAFCPSISKGLMPDPHLQKMNSSPVLQNVRKGDVKRVLYYITKAGLGQVYVSLGKAHQIKPGTVLNTFRHLSLGNGDSKFKSGQIKVTHLMGSYAVAEIIAQQELPYDSNYSSYPGVMAGDSIEKPSYLVQRVVHSLPELDIPYSQLFTEPKARPSSIELSSLGKLHLKKVIKVFAERKVSHLFISGYTGREGNTQANQVESLQRALAVRQYLITQLDFDPERITALGMGESDLKDPSNVSGHRQANRRIVIKASTSATH